MKNEVANFIQHIAVIFEVLSLVLVIYDLKCHKKDRGLNPLRMVTSGYISGIKDRSKGFYIGIGLASLAILMELYQLACIYFAE